MLTGTRMKEPVSPPTAADVSNVDPWPLVWPLLCRVCPLLRTSLTTWTCYKSTYACGGGGLVTFIPMLPLFFAWNGRAWRVVSFSGLIGAPPLRLRVGAPVGAILYKTHHPPHLLNHLSFFDKHHRTPPPCLVQQTTGSHSVPTYPAR